MKPGTVPTIYCEVDEDSKRTERMSVRKNKNIVSNLLEQTNVENITTDFEVSADVEPEDWKA